MFLLFPALAMSLGWGLRGTIGGGPMGATIPGAMIALALALLLRRDYRAAIVAVFGVVGIGLGGQMTYGQTIGLVRDIDNPGNFWWGFTGLAVKGAVWGLSGGAILGLGLVRNRFTHREILTSLALMVAGTFAGWALINQPKLIYFSDRHNEPRAEIWAGLLFGASAMLGYLSSLKRSRVPLSFAIWGLLAGGIGFGGGGLFNSLGQVVPAKYAKWSWWKMMELFFGLLLGLGYGMAAWRHRDELRTQPESGVNESVYGSFSWSALLTAIALTFGMLWLQFHLRTPATFTILGAILILMALSHPSFAWHIAISFTVVAFIRDLFTWLGIGMWKRANIDSPITPQHVWLWTIVAAVVVVACVAYQARFGKLTTAWGFLFVTWGGVIVSVVKNFAPIARAGLKKTLENPNLIAVQSTFVVSAIVLTAMVWQLDRESNPSD